MNQKSQKKLNVNFCAYFQISLRGWLKLQEISNQMIHNINKLYTLLFLLSEAWMKTGFKASHRNFSYLSPEGPLRLGLQG